MESTDIVARDIENLNLKSKIEIKNYYLKK